MQQVGYFHKRVLPSNTMNVLKYNRACEANLRFGAKIHKATLPQTTKSYVLHQNSQLLAVVQQYQHSFLIFFYFFLKNEDPNKTISDGTFPQAEPLSPCVKTMTLTYCLVCAGDCNSEQEWALLHQHSSQQRRHIQQKEQVVLQLLPHANAHILVDKTQAGSSKQVPCLQVWDQLATVWKLVTPASSCFFKAAIYFGLQKLFTTKYIQI